MLIDNLVAIMFRNQRVSILVLRAEALLGAPILPHSRVICRLFANNPNEYATPPHRDFTWNGGSERTWTAWIPLVEVPPALGGLSVVSGSHRLPVRFRGADERGGLIVPPAQPWHTAELYRPGDVLFFSSKTVHAALGNSMKGRLRLSVECRFQPLADPVRDDSLEPHWNAFGLGWEGIYAQWPTADDPVKYFWRRLDPRIESSTPAGTYRQNLRQRAIQNTFGALMFQGARHEASQ